MGFARLGFVRVRTTSPDVHTHAITASMSGTLRSRGALVNQDWEILIANTPIPAYPQGTGRISKEADMDSVVLIVAIIIGWFCSAGIVAVGMGRAIHLRDHGGR